MSAIQIVLPECSDDLVSDLLRHITKAIADATGDETGYGLGGRYGYGENYENDVFMMHRYCWCERSDCAWCLGCECQWNGDFCETCANDTREAAPNFLHKPSGVGVRWYKYIGRGMEVKGQGDWLAIARECIDSLAPRGAQ